MRIERAGRPAGYAYITPDGAVGPLSVAPDAKGVVEAAIRCALEGRPQQVSMIVPGVRIASWQPCRNWVSGSTVPSS